ncbi:cell filamentation protein Fic [Siphonobacter sp. SORGH_AS_0500]|uniref:Fic family protein n=1 Tax=Siphonobacter sp. SORGH_AS_0500 TaxID=1864824 RepID=UPI000CAD937A|nr:Fic family protein [Siphonobacter sp. SORGH_AS_0500]PKK36524.1 cell filamentation protein Fic [Siphonobacter sp. SORGH_AS_0500]
MNHEPLYTTLNQLKAEFDSYRHLDNERIRQAIELEYTYESNRIEGNTLTLRETDLVINEGMTIGGKPLKDHLEAINHRDALEFIKDIARREIPIDERVCLDIHALILRGIDPRNAGKYRDVPVLIRGSKHVPPAAYVLAEEMQKLWSWYAEATGHPVAIAAELHERLVTVHPFIDGNGRTARLLMNLVLMQHGYPIAILKGDVASRLRYYDTLEHAQTTGDKGPFITLVGETVQETLERLIKTLKG